MRARRAFSGQAARSSQAVRLYRGGYPIVALLVMLVAGTVLTPGSARASSIVRNFTTRFTATTTGDISLIGNTVMTCPTSTACSNVRAGTAAGNNNDYTMTYVDIDADTTTFNSSQATLSLPSGAQVLWAGLYWGADTAQGTGGSAAPNASLRNQVRFATPTATGYVTLTATQVDQIASSGVDYQAFANVTTQVTAGQSGIYRVANVQAATGQDRDGGWALVVAYSAPGLTPKNLTIFDGYANVNTDAPVNITIPISGFQTPPAGAVNTKIGVVSYEGDQNLTGDQMYLNSTQLSNATNPATNFFNSSISNLGTAIAAKNPDYRNQLGFDIDTVNASGILANSATSANITLTTSNEFYQPGVVTFATDVYAPILDVVKTVTDAAGNDVNGSDVAPNTVLNYTLSYSNAGTTANPSRDNALVVTLRDPIPAGLTYVPGSLRVVNGPNAGTKTDGAGDDQAEYIAASRQVVFRVGTGATGTAAGRVPIGSGGTVRFQVRTPTTGTGRDPFGNVAGSTYSGEISGVSLSGTSNTVTTYVNYRPVLSATKTDTLIDVDGDGIAEPGDSIQYQVELRNTGNGTATGSVFRDFPDTNTVLVAGSVTTTAGTITSGNSGSPPVEVNLGSLAAGATVTIGFRVAIAVPLPPDALTVANQGSLTSTNTAATLTDDLGTPEAADATSTSVQAQALVSAGKQAVLVEDLDRNGVPSPGDTLEYRFAIPNVGNRSAAGVVLRDLLDPNLILVVGSVVTSQGSVTVGNNPGDGRVEVSLGTLAGGSTATVTLRARVVTPLAAGVQQVCNGATLQTGATGVSLLGVQPIEPVCTTVVSAPQVDATKRDTLIIDADNNGIPSPGDTLLYTIDIRNDGNTAATGLVFVDTPDANSALVVGTVRTSLGTIVEGNTAGNTRVRINLGALAGSSSVASVSFRVTIVAPLPASAPQLGNQGFVSGANIADVLTDDPDTPEVADATVTLVTADPLVKAVKRDTLLIDADGNGLPSPGDTLLYTVELRNDGNANAAGVVYADTPDANAPLIAGSVQTAFGSVVQGNAGGDTRVRVNVGTLPGGSSVSLQYQVRIVSPLPAGVTQVSNQGTVGASNYPSIVTDDPDTLESSDATVTAVTAQPLPVVTKQVQLETDVNNNGRAEPGDRLRYNVRIQNQGNANLAGAEFTDAPDPNAPLVVGSVRTSQGEVAIGNALGDPTVRVVLGTIAGGGAADISFSVLITSPLAAGVTEISNQGLLASSNAASVLSDDPETLAPGDPTRTAVIARPLVSSTKRATLSTDADNNAIPSPGDTLLYTIDIRNDGNTAATGLVFVDSPDPNSVLVAGSVQTSLGTITEGNAGGDSSVRINLGTLDGGGGSASVSFRVTIVVPLPAGVSQISNQAFISSANQADVLTDNPDTPEVDDATVTLVTANPLLRAVKRDSLVLDADGNGLPSPGDTLLYTVELRNDGNANAAGVVYADTPDPNTSLVAGSVQTTLGSVTRGNTGGDIAVEVAIGTLVGGGSGTLQYQVRITTPLPAGVTQVRNQGTIGASNYPSIVTDDPDTLESSDATVTAVTAQPLPVAAKQVQLEVDANDNGIAEPGDRLRYNVRLQNDGNANLAGAEFNDPPDVNTTLVAGSVRTDAGTIALGNGAGDQSVRVTIPAIGGSGGFVDISFSVVIVSPLPAGVSSVRNQGTLTATNAPAAVTDDPLTSEIDDPTVTPITASPLLTSAKRDTLLTDADANGVPSPGDTLLYTIELRNDGNTAATGLLFVDTPDSNTGLVAGSVQTDLGSVVEGNAGGDSAVRVALGTLNGGGNTATISFRVVIVSPLLAGVAQVGNQGSISGGNVPDILTDDPDTPELEDATVTSVTANPLLEVVKRGSLQIDSDANSIPSPGDTLLFTIELRNEGNANAAGVTFIDAPDPNTTLLVGTVQTTLGSVTRGNTAGDRGVEVAVGTLAGNQSVTLQYEVRIVSPLPAGVTQVSNQGTVSASNYPSIVTDDPDTLESNDATVTAVTAQPLPVAAKQVQLEVDANDNGIAEPGDRLRYNVRLQNAGNANLADAEFNDPPDVNTTLVVGSVQTSQGTVELGNAAGEQTVRVLLGTIAGGGDASISFSVVIVSPLPTGVTEISNQGILTAANAPASLSDEPQTAVPGDPTIISVVAQPRMSATKRSVLIDVGAQDGVAGPGDTLLYEVELRNDGNTAATGVVFADPPDENSPLVVGSVVASPGITVVRGNTAGDTGVEARIDSFAAGSSLNLSFRVTIPAGIPSSVTQIRNQGSEAGTNFQTLPTDDPETLEVDDVTITPLRFPLLASTKRFALEQDVDASGDVTPGDRLIYTIEIENRGPAAAIGVVFDDTPDPNTRLVDGSVATSVGSITRGNNGGDTSVGVNVGSLPPDALVSISFSVVIVTDAAVPFDRVTNQGAVTSTNTGELSTDDPTTPGAGDGTITPVEFDPTAVTLLSFTATRGDNGITVRWTTGVELDTLGFHLLRSSDGRRSSATRVTQQLIPARGGGGATSYEWLDTKVEPGTTYTYWLQEQETGGKVNEYGPVQSVEPSRLQRSFLPLIQ